MNKCVPGGAKCAAAAAAIMGVEHGGQHGLDGVERAVHVDAEVAMPQVVGDVLEQGLAGHAGVVHQQGHRAEGVLQAADHIVDLGAVRHVGPQGQGAAAGGGELGHQTVGAVLPDAVIHAHGVAVGGQLTGHGAADAAGSAGDQRDLFHKNISLPSI